MKSIVLIIGLLFSLNSFADEENCKSEICAKPNEVTGLYEIYTNGYCYRSCLISKNGHNKCYENSHTGEIFCNPTKAKK